MKEKPVTDREGGYDLKRANMREFQGTALYLSPHMVKLINFLKLTEQMIFIPLSPHICPKLPYHPCSFLNQ